MFNLWLKLVLLGLTVMVTSCGPGGGGGWNANLDPDLRPIYLSYSQLNDIRNSRERDVIKSGDIVLRGSTFFMMEQGEGIHVYDVGDPEMHTYVTFLKIPALSGYSVNGDRLYINQWTRLLTIDITDIYNIKITDIQHNAFQPDLFPPNHNGYFECVDLDIGAVIGWRENNVSNPKCRTL